jgi:hypothetical protein
LRLRPVLRTRNFALLLARLPLILAAGALRSRMLVIIPAVLSRDRESERQH